MQVVSILQKRFRGGGWSAGRSHAGDERGLTLVARGDRTMKIMQNLAKRSGVLKKTFLSSFYELPNWRRNREKAERAHFSRWHYLKYCTQVLQYGLKYAQRALPLAKAQVPVANDLLNVAKVQWPKAKKDAFTEDELRAISQAFNRV